MWFTTSSGRIELELTRDEAHSGYHQGTCDDDIAWLRKQTHIKDQLEKIKPALLREELRHWGAWDADELSDHEANLNRILWLACGDLVDNPTDDNEEQSQ